MPDREIKFRAWDGWRMIFFSDLQVDFSISKNPQVVFSKDTFNGTCSIGNYKVMQFVGLNDVDGKEIYEEDILQVTANPYHGRYTVKFGEYILKKFMKHDVPVPHIGWYLENDDNIISLMDCIKQPTGYGSSTHSVKVIGNIYESVESLNDK